MNKRINLFISGQVQGVFFRASTKKQAVKLDITGFVRNLPDGRVEVVAEGCPEAVEKLISWCHQGPLGAKVDEVEIIEILQPEEFFDFEIKV